jgi:hypothetical protein
MLPRDNLGALNGVPGNAEAPAISRCRRWISLSMNGGRHGTTLTSQAGADRVVSAPATWARCLSCRVASSITAVAAIIHRTHDHRTLEPADPRAGRPSSRQTLEPACDRKRLLSTPRRWPANARLPGLGPVAENMENPAPVQLKSLAKVIRSKNAGPCLLTLDLMLTDKAAFAYVVERIATLRRVVAERYRRSENEVAVLPFAPALAVKITLPRDVISGDIGDRDIYGAQQHAPLLDVEL